MTESRSLFRTMLMFGVALVATSFVLFTTACNTIEGAGEDIEAVGSETSETARDVAD